MPEIDRAGEGDRPTGVSRARALRQSQTEAEKALWRLLRDRRLAAAKFRRQVPIGRYIADFACLAHRLIVEADGSQHAENRHDARRDAWLAMQGFRILRFWNNDILARRQQVLETIFAALASPPHPPAGTLSREGRGRHAEAKAPSLLPLREKVPAQPPDEGAGAVPAAKGIAP